MAKRRFTKYPSGYVKASSDFKYNDAPLIENIDDWGPADWAYYLAEDDEEYNNIINAINIGLGKNILSGYADRLYDIALEDEFKRFISGYIKASEEVCNSAHWEAIAEFSDGTTLEFTRPVTVSGLEAEADQQYAIECELLDKATNTGKEVEFYTVNFVCDD